MGLFGPTPEKVEKWVSKGQVSKLISSLKSEDALIRRLASEGLAQIGGPEVMQFCKENARNSDEQLRWSVTQILGQMGTPEAMKLLGTVQDPSDAIAAQRKKQTEEH